MNISDNTDALSEFEGELAVFKVFISHSSEDLGVVSKISDSLKKEGVKAYVAESYPEPGKMLPEKIMENLRASDCVVVVLTEAGVKSPWVQQEIGIAKTLNLPIVPLVGKGVAVKGLLEGVEYIPLDLQNLEVAIDVLLRAIGRVRNSKPTYTTGEAAKLLGVSFITIKRWIYSGKLKATKTPSGWYRISGAEIERLQRDLREEQIDEFEKELISIVQEKKVAYLRELQVCLEDTYLHSDTYHKLNSIVDCKLQTRFEYGNRWYFPLELGWEDVKKIADHKSKLIDVYSSHPRRFERRNVVYMDYAEFLVEGAMIQAGYMIVAKDTYYFNGIAYKQNRGPGRPKDLDFIAYIPNKEVYVGVQVKNRMGYPKRDMISEFLDICRALNLKPLLVTRSAHRAVFPLVERMGGRTIVYKRYFLQPPFPREKFKELVNLGIPLGVYKWPPEFLVNRFVEAGGELEI